MENGNLVEVRNAYKRYGSSPPVLRGLHMNVKKGTIYSLLGPSGCGKTTLLSCIVGRKYLDSGDVKIGLSKKSDIGYMPQDVALHQDFTIGEIFIFYGTLFDLSPLLVEKRSKELCDLLELPHQGRFIKTLSGGQQRRVSFAVALLHSPQLLVLDEPTVGVDPVLCHNIWLHLMKIASSEKKTIIITTHYIEEARQSNTIGLMRNGVLLAETRPNDLISSHGCSSLEEAFLLLSKKQTEETNQNNNNNNWVTPKKTPPKSPFTKVYSFQTSRFLAQLWKNILWIKRNIGVLLFILFLPALQSFLFCSSFGRDPENLNIGLVSDELAVASEMCDQVVNNVTYSPLLECNIPYSFTCHFWKQLTSRINVEFYGDLSEAKAAVSRNEIWGVLHVTQNFSRAIEERLSDGIHTKDFVVDQSAISVWLDMSNYIISSLVKRKIVTGLVEFIKDVLETCGIPRSVGSIPIRLNDAIFGNNDTIFAHSSAPSFICSFLFYFTMVFTSGAIKMEKLAGLIERSMVAGMTWLEIVCAHLVVQFILMTLQAFFMMIIMYVFYSNPLNGNFMLTVTLLYFVAFVGIAFGFLLNEFFEEEKLISYAGIGITMCLFLVNGCVWPIEGAHHLLRATSRLLPIVAAVESYNSITNRGFGIEDRTVMLGFISCIAWISIFTLFTQIVSMRKR